ncbi:MAG: cytochrome C peroxidase [Verrucomicrobia bacterium]|nr:cytochrome C peroxidase [Verrucomicrobiota bacterium]
MRCILWLLLFASPLSAANLTLRFEPRWRDAALAVPSGELRTEGGQTLRLTRLAALVSGVALERADGSVVRLDGQYGFIDATDRRLTVTLRQVPRGEYTGIAFSLGLGPEENHGDPAHWPAGHPLNPLVNRLHWGWSGGYVFLALEGRWRAAEQDESGFSYHVATDAHRMTVRFQALFTVEGDTTADFSMDLARVLGARTFTRGAAESTHSAAGDATATEIATAMERAFFWLGVTPGPAQPETAEAAVAPSAFVVPAGFPQPALPADNPLTAAGIALGAELFRDKRLSGNGTQSCASCHDLKRAGSDTVALSRGADGHPGVRNAMPLFNLAWSTSGYAWDGSKARVRDQALAAMTNPIEMHADPARVVAALAGDVALTEKFRAVFGVGAGEPAITNGRLTLALEQYLLTLVSADAKFDRAVRGEAQFTAQEKRGFELFLTEYDPARGKRGADCFHCHGGALFTDFGVKSNGLDLVSKDAGRGGVTGRATDSGKFKTPSLRNVALTAPYMHDGRFATLADVVAHYDHGVQRSENLDANLAKHPAAGLALSAEDRSALVAFLETLTDRQFEVAQASRLPTK